MATTSKGNSLALETFLGYKVDHFIGYKTFEKDGSKFINEEFRINWVENYKVIAYMYKRLYIYLLFSLGCILEVYFGSKQRKPFITNYTTTSFL